MKMYGECGCSYAMALEGDNVSVSRPGRFSPGKKATGTHCIRDWVGPMTGLNVPSPLPVVQPVALRYNR